MHAQHPVGAGCLEAAVVDDAGVEGVLASVRLPITLRWAASSTLLSDVLASAASRRQAVLEVQRTAPVTPARRPGASPFSQTGRQEDQRAVGVDRSAARRPGSAGSDRASCSAAM